ncbi:MAG: DUF3592 domain-containing protein [Actinomycetota bacterium]
MDESELAGLIFIGAGGLACLVGVFLIQRRRAFVRTSTATQGIVTGLIASSGSEGGTVYSRSVTFTTAEGKRVDFTESSGASNVKQKPGDPIPVRYQPDRPDKAIIATWYGTWFWALFPILLGLGFAIPGLLVFLVGGGDATPASVSSPSVTAPTFGDPTFDPTTLPPGPTTPGGTVVSARDPSGSRAANATCGHVRDGEGGSVREFELLLDGADTVVLTARPFDGEGVYHAGSTLTVGGSFFEGSTGAFSGVLVVDDTGQGGSINVSSDSHSVSGTWDCTGEPVG